MNYKFRIKPLLIIIGCIFLLFTIILAIRMIQIGFPKEIYMFADISECYNIQNTNKTATISRYETPTFDPAWRKVPYLSFFSVDYADSNMRFRIFAYEYLTTNQSQEYYHVATGKYPKKNTSFSMSSGGVSSVLELIVIDDNRIYRIETTPQDFKNVMELLNEHFSINVLEKRN